MIQADRVLKLVNINVVAHQRNILKTLGIDVWVPRQGSHTQRADYSTYRDTQTNFAVPPVMGAEMQQTMPSPQNHSVDQAVGRANPVIAAPVAEFNDIAIKRAKATVVEEAAIVTPARAVIAQEPAIELAAFELQAYVLSDCVLLLDVQEMNADQQRLWSNIQAAKPGDYFELKWPFALAQFQDGRGASLYIQGFIDGLAQDKKVISLGRLVHLENSEVICLASLAEMIEQPILKKRLWQFMQSHAMHKEVV